MSEPKSRVMETAADADLVIAGGTVITMVPDEEPAPRDVFVSGTRITDVVPAGARPIPEGVRLLDASGCIVIPGLIDTHRHVWQLPLRGVGIDFTHKDYLRAIRMNAATFFDPEDMRTGNYAGMLDALSAGVTTVLDHSHNVLSNEHALAALAGTRASGGRAVFAYGLNPPPGIDDSIATAEARLAAAANLYREEFRGEPRDQRVQLGIALPDAWRSGTNSVSDGITFAREHDLLITLHACAKLLRTPVSEVALLAEQDLIGPHMVWSHMPLATHDELALVLDAGGNVSVTPHTELQMGMGQPATGRVLALGHLPSLGADVVSSNTGDLFDVMRQALQAERHRVNLHTLREQGSWIDEIGLSARTILEAATRGGAEAVGLGDELGAVEAGRLADLVVVSTDDIGMAPVHDPIAAVVGYATARDVRDVVVGGELLKQDGALVADDWRAPLARTTERLRRQLEVHGLVPLPLHPLPT